MFKQFSKLFIGLLFFAQTLQTKSNDNNKTDALKQEITKPLDYSEAIHQLYVAQFPAEKVKTKEEFDKETLEKNKKILRSLFKPITLEPYPFNDTEMKKVAHGIIQREYKKIASNNAQSIITSPLVKKLNLIVGGDSDAGHNLANVLTQNFKSILAKEELIHQITQPTIDATLLRNKQQLIKYFQEGSVHQLQESLNQASKLEKSVLSFWHTAELVEDHFFQNAYWNKLFYIFDVSSLNKYPLALEIGRFFGHFVNVASLYFGPKILKNDLVQRAYNDLKQEFAQAVSFKQKAGVAGMFSLVAAYSGVATYAGIMANYNSQRAFYPAQEHLIDLGAYIDEIEDIASLIKKDDALLKLLPDLQHIIDINNKQKHSEKFNQLIELLKTSTFTGNASYFSYLGRVRVAYKLMLEVKNEFEPILRAMAQLNMYNGLAQLLQNYQNNGNKFCFAEFVEHGPSIEALDFWNPLVEQGTAVSNSLNLGHMKNLVLHGPNTGGKTTTIKGLMEAIILAQTLGIAPAHSLKISPFAQLNCFMDIQDDIAAGTSLFKAEVLQAKNIIDRIRKLKENEYVFTIADEVLRSTTPNEGELASCMFARKIGKMKNSTCIIVSHYPKVAQLSQEQDTTFSTKHVEIIRNNDGSITRTFKLKDGSTNENIAMDILKDAGVFDASDFD